MDQSSDCLTCSKPLTSETALVCKSSCCRCVECEKLNGFICFECQVKKIPSFLCLTMQDGEENYSASSSVSGRSIDSSITTSSSQGPSIRSSTSGNNRCDVHSLFRVETFQRSASSLQEGFGPSYSEFTSTPRASKGDVLPASVLSTFMEQHPPAEQNELATNIKRKALVAPMAAKSPIKQDGERNYSASSSVSCRSIDSSITASSSQGPAIRSSTSDNNRCDVHSLFRAETFQRSGSFLQECFGPSYYELISTPRPSKDDVHPGDSEINVRRAIFEPGSYEVRNTASVLAVFMEQDPPPEQTQLATDINRKALVVPLTTKLPIKVSDSERDRLWFSFECLAYNCGKVIFSPHICEHFLNDHPLLPAEHLSIGVCRDFFYDATLSSFRPSCTMYFLVEGALEGLKDGKFSKYFPVFLITSKLALSDIYLEDTGDQRGDDSICMNWKNSEVLLMWLTGPVPENSAIKVMLTVWASDEAGAARSCSGFVVPLNQPQDAKRIYEQSDHLCLSAMELEALTNKGKGMIQCQVVVG